ncbi:MAG: hypothetical protein LBR80_11900, partial [Deltaproteobacteria bacterium]|nr:hypothetical protein [Deltaproteobacteria bacterium]
HQELPSPLLRFILNNILDSSIYDRLFAQPRLKLPWSPKGLFSQTSGLIKGLDLSPAIDQSLL